MIFFGSFLGLHHMLYHILRILLEVLCFSFLFSSPIIMNASDGSDFGSFITIGNWPGMFPFGAYDHTPHDPKRNIRNNI